MKLAYKHSMMKRMFTRNNALYILTITHFALVTIYQPMVRLSHFNLSGEVASPPNNEEYSTNEQPDYPRILLYITSHLSSSHEEFLHRCWPYVLSNSKLVQMADVKVFLNGDVQHQSEDAEVFQYVFRGKRRQDKFSIHQVKNDGYQEGAISAMAHAHKNGWFEGYDWVVRVNPDVIIRNDAWILETIKSSDEKNVSGIFVECDWMCNQTTHCESNRYIIHSDFTAFKPSALSPTLLWNESNHAETMNSIAFASTIAKGQDQWMVDANPDVQGTCRLSTKDDSPVAHYNDEENPNGLALQCVEWFKERIFSLNSAFYSAMVSTLTL